MGEETLIVSNKKNSFNLSLILEY